MQDRMKTLRMAYKQAMKDTQDAFRHRKEVRMKHGEDSRQYNSAVRALRKANDKVQELRRRIRNQTCNVVYPG